MKKIISLMLALSLFALSLLIGPFANANSANLIKNGDFEIFPARESSNPPGYCWSAANALEANFYAAGQSLDAIVMEGVGRNASRGLFINDIRPGNYIALRSERIDVDHTKGYNFSAWVKPVEGNCRIGIRKLNNEGAEQGAVYWTDTPEFVEGNDWQEVQLSLGPAGAGADVVLTSATTKLEIVILSSYTNTRMDKAYFDDISLTEKSDTDLIPPEWTEPNFIASNITPTTVELEWTAPDSINGLKEYTLIAKDIKTGKTATSILDAGVESTVVTGLSPGREYMMTLQATDEKNNSTTDGPVISSVVTSFGISLINGNFENGYEGWFVYNGPENSPYANVSKEISTTVTKNSGVSLHLTDNNQGSGYVNVSQRVAVDPLKKYAISGWVKPESGYVSVKINPFNSDGVLQGVSNEFLFNASESTQWQEISQIGARQGGDLVISAQTKYLEFIFNASEGAVSNSTGEGYFADFSIEEILPIMSIDCKFKNATDEDRDITQTGLESGDIKAEIVLKNNSTDPLPAVGIMALYDDNKLLHVTMAQTDEDIAAGAQKTLTIPAIGVDDPTDKYSLKVFVWKDLYAFEPYASRQYALKKNKQ
ncbi:MAG: carbohydrate binding domain-containing protein [Firmicutes bacterium]|nr:carbohydrate binding domain-containing protein [Bacillota bacterium]